MLLAAHELLERLGSVAIAFSLCLLLGSACRAEVIWVEGENPFRASVTRHPWWYDKVKRDQLSGGDFISNWDPNKVGEVEYHFNAKQAGSYEFWIRANPVQSSMTYQLNGGEQKSVDMNANVGATNIAADNGLDVRFIAWLKIGRVPLNRGENTVVFRFTSQNNHHGYLDCFVFDTEAFEPHGILKPGEEKTAVSGDQSGWFQFDPAADAFMPTPINLRRLNERSAGDGGFIAVKRGEFVHGNTGLPVRFWGVDGPPADLTDLEGLRQCARMLAKHGVNLVRIHHPYSDENGNVDPKAVQHAIDIVEAMKAEGIYCHFSIYYYQWFRPKADNKWLEGYDGTKPPSSVIFFNPAYQQQYREWWRALLLTPGARSGKRLIDEPAVSSVEVLNEDSLFFWTFDPKSIPKPQLDIIEARFAAWLEKKYGSIDGAVSAWGGLHFVNGDAPDQGRMGIRGLWQIANEKTMRDIDTADFLADTERDFYRQTKDFLHEIGFKGLVTDSNWTTADAQTLGPLERYAYTAGDFIDRHWYLDCQCDGPDAGWSIRDGYTFIDRSMLRFDPAVFGKPKVLSSGVMDTHIDGKPSMMSEVDFNRPNRFRSEGPLYLAAYGSLQGSNSIEHFALDGAHWGVKPGFFMQPWTLMSPGMMGQFPAAALIYRLGLIGEGAQLVDLNLKVKDLMDLRGAPRGLEGDVDESMPVSPSGPIDASGLIDPLACFAGRTSIHYSQDGGPCNIKPLSAYVDRAHRTVVSTNGQLKLDYANGILAINAPQAQGISGDIAKAGNVRLADLVISSPMELGHIIAVSLDGQPLSKSRQILLQVASEEKNNGFRTSAVGNGRQQIISIGQDPWLMKAMAGSVKMTRPDASALKVTALNLNGYPKKALGDAQDIQLLPDTMYYLIAP
jgi:hypothetical protein